MAFAVINGDLPFAGGAMTQFDSVRWLHVSDFHAGLNPTAQETMFSRIVNRVRARRLSGFVPDLLIISGDIAQSGAAAQYAFFQERLYQPLSEAIGEEIVKRTFFVPGNHDVARHVRQGFDFDGGSKLRPYFEPTDLGLQERQIITPRFTAYADFVQRVAPEQAGWLDSTAAHWSKIVELPDGRGAVGISLLNTAWLCRGDADNRTLLVGPEIVQHALLAIKDCHPKIVVGHHPLRWLTYEDEDAVWRLFRQHGAIYLHGHDHKEKLFHPPITAPQQAILVQALAAYHARDWEKNKNGIIWGEATSEHIWLQPDFWVPSDSAWRLQAPNFPPETRFERDSQPWWRWPVPRKDGEPLPSVAREIDVEIELTRFSRRTRGNRIVDEHAERGGDEDVGREQLERQPLLVSEALAFFRRTLLIGESGSGKTFALDRLYRTLARAVRVSHPRDIHIAYPEWRHAALPMPIRIDAPDFADWLALRDEIGRTAGGDPAVLSYVTDAARPEGCPERDLLRLRAYCHRESFYLIVDEWGALTDDQAKDVWEQLSRFLGPFRDRPAVVISTRLNPSRLSLPFLDARGEFEQVTVARLSPEKQDLFVERYCELHGKQWRPSPSSPPSPPTAPPSAQPFDSPDVIRELLNHYPRLADTPSTLRVLLDEWLTGAGLEPQRGYPDLHRLVLARELRGTALTLDISVTQQLADLLLVAYRDDASVPLLTVALDDADARPLLANELIRQHRDGKYSMRRAAMQDYLVAWSLKQAVERRQISRELDDIFKLKKRLPRREPVKLMLLWLWREGPRYDNVELPVDLLLEQANSQATLAVADFVAEAGVTIDADDRLVRRLRRDGAPQFISELDKPKSALPPVDRYVLGCAIAICGDTRKGVGLDDEGVLPSFSWKVAQPGRATLGSRESDIKLYDWRVPPDDEPHREFEAAEPFWLSEYPVTNLQFAAFVADKIHGYDSHSSQGPWRGLHRPERRWKLVRGTENQPAAWISWDEAKAFCRWFSRVAGYPIDLPGSDQWEYAARGPSGEGVFTRGGIAPVINSEREGLPGASAVGVFPDSACDLTGCQDLCGNVFEWCADAHSPDSDKRDFMVTKGGSYNHDLLRCRVALRGKKHRDSQHPYLGFRVAAAQRPQPPDRQRVLLVGGGFAGTCTAIRLMAQLDEPTEVIMVEERPELAFGGLAYSAATAEWEHLFNLQAGRVSLYREDRDDFKNWLNDGATDRTGWHDQFRKKVFERGSAVPRRLYQQYLIDRLRTAALDAHPAVCFKLVIGMLTRVDNPTAPAFSKDGAPLAHKVRLQRGDRDVEVPPCHQLVLCTGNRQTRRPKGIDPDDHHLPYMSDQYGPGPRRIIQRLNPGDTVLVLGTALRAYDVVMTLHSDLSNLRNESVRIILLSRFGRTHAAYANKHEHAVLPIDPPQLIRRLQKDEPLTDEQIVDAIKADYEMAVQHPCLRGVPAELQSERILKAWEQYVPEAMARVSAEQGRRLLSRYRSLITVKRILVVPEIASVVQESIRLGRCRVIAGELMSVKPQAGTTGPVMVTIRARKDVVEASWEENDEIVEWPLTVNLIINCLGREQDYSELRDQLWEQLLQSGVARRHDVTGVGIEVDCRGRLVNQTRDNESEWIAAVGVMREGVEFTRHGRLGSFSFTLGPIKNQALEVATYLIRRLRNDWTDNQWIQECAAIVLQTPSPTDPAFLLAAIRASITHVTHAQRVDLGRPPDVIGQTVNAVLSASVVPGPLSLLIERLKARTQRARKPIDSILKTLQEQLAIRLAADTGAHPMKATEFARKLLLALEEIAIAHLTRLDQVQPVT